MKQIKDTTKFIVAAVIIGLCFFAAVKTTTKLVKIAAAESSGFYIGEGVLQQEYRCRQVVKYVNIEDAKKQIEMYQKAMKNNKS